MSYNSFVYLFVFLVLAWLAWALLPQKWRPGALLAASLVFYAVSARQYTVYILATAAVCWVAGQQLGRLDALFQAARKDLPPPARKEMKQRVAALKKLTVGASAAAVLAVLLAVKYLPLFARLAAAVAARLPGSPALALPAFVQPLGLSFFTLMAAGYLVDIYRGVSEPAEHYWQVLLFLSFWPHVVEGPFDRWGALRPALLDPPAPSYRDLTFGIQRIVWGLFKKMVVADRAYVYVRAVFDDWTQYSGAAVIAGVVMYTLELYAEFSGCMDIALGSAELFGVHLAENFRQPFFARSVGEFWRRWHITLGAWLREYVFQPLCLGRPLQRFGRFCRERFGPAAARKWPVWLALCLTWALIGLWHGAAAIYLVYGLYYFALQWLGEAAEPALVKVLPNLGAWRQKPAWHVWQVVRTWGFVGFGMLLFRANGVRAAWQMLVSLLCPYAGSLLIKIDARDAMVLAAGAALMLAVDWAHERGHRLRHALAARPLPLRWAVYVGAVLLVMIFGAYGDNYEPAAFIYAQF